jgi:hypothetical protein
MKQKGLTPYCFDAQEADNTRGIEQGSSVPDFSGAAACFRWVTSIDRKK